MLSIVNLMESLSSDISAVGKVNLTGLLLLYFKQEDDLMIELVGKYGPKKWSTIAQALPGRIGKQCRERYDCLNIRSL